MNELLLHERWVIDHATDKVAALTLVDHEQELRGLTRFAALRAVGRLRKHTRDAAQLCEAAERLAENKFGHISIRSRIIMATAVDTDEPVQIVLRPGSRPPVAYGCEYGEDEGIWSYWSITVGARWVLARAAEFDRAVSDFSPYLFAPDGDLINR